MKTTVTRDMLRYLAGGGADPLAVARFLDGGAGLLAVADYRAVIHAWRCNVERDHTSDVHHAAIRRARTA